MLEQQIALLKQFISVCEADPSILHTPQMKFYRDYLESLGATIPPPRRDRDDPMSGEEKSRQQAPPPQQQEDEEAEEEIPPPEIDQSGVIEPEGDEDLPMGDAGIQASEADIEKANEERDLAAAAFSEGDLQSAVDHYTQAIISNPGSAILHAKRANALLKLKKPLAAIRDCDHAVRINPDSAAGYKFRGRANRLLGKWLEAHHDLAIACKLDWDETTNEWLKEVEPNAKKLQEYERAKQRRQEEKELRARRERVQKAQEANRRAAEETDQGAGGGFGMGPFSELFKELADEPEVLQMLKDDPSLIQKLMEIMNNPQNMMKHMNDPGVQKIISKMGARMGAAGPEKAEENEFGAPPPTADTHKSGKEEATPLPPQQKSRTPHSSVNDVD